MNKKSILGLLLFGSLVIASLFYGATLMTRYEPGTNADQMVKEDTNDTVEYDTSLDNDKNTKDIVQDNEILEYAKEESEQSTELSNHEDRESEPSSAGNIAPEEAANINIDSLGSSAQEGVSPDSDAKEKTASVDETEILGASTEASTSNIKEGILLEAPTRELIIDSTKVDYLAYIPEMIYTSKLEEALAIDNPKISIKAEAAILFDVETKKVIYHKNPVNAVFPASTAKLLTALTALEWCGLEEVVTVGEEIKLITTDSTRANLHEEEILTINNLLEGMLLPSGNDAAYVIATHIGRKALQNPEASCEEAVTEFVRLMNSKAKTLGAVNSCFKTPDGYDALGQYTTAYDMGMIGLAAAGDEIILNITQKSSSRNVYVSGKDVTWNNTNALIKRSSPHYYSNCTGLKTGTSTMAGKCLIAGGQKNGKEVLAVVMDSTTSGRWSDTIALLDYGLSR